MSSSMEEVKTRAPAVQNRIDIINGMWPLTQATKEAMNRIREAISEATKAVVIAAETVNYDEMKLIACLDALQSAKDIGCASVILGSK